MSGRGRDLIRVALPFYGNLAVACQGERCTDAGIPYRGKLKQGPASISRI